jgi:hypothetical protein
VSTGLADVELISAVFLPFQGETQLERADHPHPIRRLIRQQSKNGDVPGKHSLLCVRLCGRKGFLGCNTNALDVFPLHPRGGFLGEVKLVLLAGLLRTLQVQRPELQDDAVFLRPAPPNAHKAGSCCKGSCHLCCVAVLASLCVDELLDVALCCCANLRIRKDIQRGRRLD